MDWAINFTLQFYFFYLAVGSGADGVDHGRFQVDEEGARHLFAARCLAEEGTEGAARVAVLVGRRRTYEKPQWMTTANLDSPRPWPYSPQSLQDAISNLICWSLQYFASIELK